MLVREIITKGAGSVHPIAPWIAAAAGGVLLFAGYAGFDQFYLAWFCLVPVLWAINGQAPGRAFLIGWVAGIAAHAGGFYWVATMLRQFAEAPWPLAVMGLLLLATANGLVIAIWAWATRLISGNSGWSLVWIAPVVWTAVEKFIPQLFPNYLGASQYKILFLTQISDITGILGVTFLLVYANAVIYSVIEAIARRRPQPWRPAVVFTAVVAVVLGYGAVRIHMMDEAVLKAKSLSVGVIQTNRGAADKHVDNELFLREHHEMSRELLALQPLDIIVWPESVLGVNLPTREGVLPANLIGDLRTPLLFGAVIQTREHGERRMYNSAVLTDGGGRILGTYDKTVLVPFGEYIPFGDIFPQFYSWSPYSGRFWSGSNREPIDLNGNALSVNVCYEDIFPVHIRKLMQGGRNSRIPDAMFNVTNDSWYGDTVQPMEHLVLASFRSIEHRRSLIRSTNTGISAIVDPVGRVDLRTGQWTKASLAGKIPLMKGRTIYSIAGDWIGWLTAFMALFGLGRAIQEKRRLAKSGVMKTPGETANSGNPLQRSKKAH